jgi:hypothetical protein
MPSVGKQDYVFGWAFHAITIKLAKKCRENHAGLAEQKVLRLARV